MINEALVAVDQSTGCHVWHGRIMIAGYGVMYDPSTQKKVLAHRVAYQATIGPIPPGFEIDHLCRNRKCVNPQHLEAVNHRENTLRGSGPSAVNARKTECVRGHPFTLANTRIRSNGKRQCRECDRLREPRRIRNRRVGGS